MPVRLAPLLLQPLLLLLLSVGHLAGQRSRKAVKGLRGGSGGLILAVEFWAGVVGIQGEPGQDNAGQ